MYLWDVEELLTVNSEEGINESQASTLENDVIIVKPPKRSSNQV